MTSNDECLPLACCLEYYITPARFATRFALVRLRVWLRSYSGSALTRARPGRAWTFPSTLILKDCLTRRVPMRKLFTLNL